MYRYKERKNGFRKFIKTFTLIIIFTSISIFIFDIYINTNVYSKEENNKTTSIAKEEKEEDITKILENTIKSTVGISKIRNIGTSIFLDNSISDLELGSGIIVSENGYILTNWHIAGNKYNNCYVTLENGKTLNGDVVWANKDLDLAIIKTDVNNLNRVLLGDSDKVKTGEQVYAIGNPTGIEFKRTVSAGIISGTNKTIKIDDGKESIYIEDLIQTEASINSSNSGGPLINSNGEVIGINSTKIVNGKETGFVIPINTVKPIIERIIKEGKFEEASIGIFGYDKEVISYLNPNIEIEFGIYVAEINKEEQAENWKEIKIGDIITKVDEIEINKMSQLRSYIYRKNIGDEINLTIIRNNREKNIKIKLEERKT